MEDPALVGVVDRLGDGDDEAGDGSRVVGHPPQPAFQAAALHQLHAEEGQSAHLCRPRRWG